MTITAHFDLVNSAGVDQDSVNLLKGVATEALRLWGNALAGKATIDVRIEIDSGLPASVLAQGRSTRGAVIASTYWIGSPALQLEGNTVKNGSADPDITIRVNADALNKMYLDPTPRTHTAPQPGMYDGLGILLHEFAHGLGFDTEYNVATGSLGGDLKTPFDDHLSLNGNMAFFQGSNVRDGLSMATGNFTHYDSANSGLQYGLMTPVAAPGHMYSIGAIELAILADTGLGTVNDDILDRPFLPSMRGGAGDDQIFGGDGNNLLQGDAGNDTVSGGGGNDRLFGGDGIDRLIGGDGNDVLDGGSSPDRLIGGAGNDVYIINDSADAVQEYTLLGASRMDDGGTDTVRSSISYKLSDADYVENLVLTGAGPTDGYGSALANYITGNIAANSLFGLSGSDTLSGGGGDDWLCGGAGIDILVGGAGSDSFAFDSQSGGSADRDIIRDFHHDEHDLIVLSQAAMPGLAQTGAFPESEFFAGAGATRAHDATDRIIYNSETGVLYYDADGLGGDRPVALAVLTGHPDLTVYDFLITA